MNDVLNSFEYMSIYIEKTNEDCIFNSYKEGDVCKGKLYYIKIFQ